MSNSGGKGPSKSSLLDIQAEQERERRQKNSSNDNRLTINNRSRGLSPKGGSGKDFHRNDNSGRHHHHASSGPRNRDGNRNNNNFTGSSGRRSGGSGSFDLSRLPLEQGVIGTLKDSFGFILCADRPDEVFFHYSQVVDNVPLQIDDSVEYRLQKQSDANSGGNAKVAAMQIRKLDTPIVWEVEDKPGKRYRGVVERSTRFDRGSNLDGAIRILPNQSESDEITVEGSKMVGVDAPDAPLVRFNVQDYQAPLHAGEDANDSAINNSSMVARSASAPRASNRLSRGDLVEFILFTNRRNKEKYARNITLIMSEKERQRQEQERKLLEAATLEHGVVTALKGEYGFLRSNKRREEVYFHFSAVNLEENECDGSAEAVLKEGQEMKFLVVNESPGQSSNNNMSGGESRRRVSARQVQMQPRGSVKFHDALACGVTGIVTRCPQPVDSGHSLEHRGLVCLHEPLVDEDDDGNQRMISEVYLSTKDSPGGTFAFRGGTSVSCWVQEGDILLFDVVRDFVDGACHASPTKHLFPNPTPLELEVEDIENDPACRVRLIELAWIARAEGVVNAVKDAYGFIHFAERPVDVHFKLYQLLPDELQADIRRNAGLPDVDAHGKPLVLNIGSEVQFDISVHGTIHASVGKNHQQQHSGGGKGRQQHSQHERENLKAQRILLLPPNTVQLTKTLAQGMRSVVAKVNPNQFDAGTINLDNPVMPMTLEERHPLVSKMIDKYLGCDKQAPIIFHDVQSRNEEATIFELLELKANGVLTWTHLPDDHHNPNHAGKLCISKVGSVVDNDVGDNTKNDGKWAPTIEEGADSKETNSTMNDNSGVQADLNDELERGKMDDNFDNTKAPKNTLSKKKKKEVKLVTSIHYDKSNMIDNLKNDEPLSVGDVVESEIIQYKRTGQVQPLNLRIVERQTIEINPTGECGCVGVVKDLSLDRNFGIIQILDDDIKTRDAFFFKPNETSKKQLKLKKGDGVKFDVGVDKNGKLMALNVTLLPKGEISGSFDKKMCRGYILLQPSHTSTKANPVRQASSNERYSRWDSGEEKGTTALATVDSTKELGCILLIDDPMNLFSAKNLAHPSSAMEIDDNNEAKDSIIEGKKCNCVHLNYKSSMVVKSDAGISSSDDSSPPRRGDLVSFIKSKSGKNSIRDIRVVSRRSATLSRGCLENIQLTGEHNSNNSGRANFVVDSLEEEIYDVDLSEIVGCEVSLLKEKEAVEGIYHNGTIHGICRIADLYLESKADRNNKERPKLNLSVKKDRGGKIIAQSMIAKGPDKTNGFEQGWTTRVSKYV